MKFKYYYMLLGVLLMVSCNKDIVTNLEAPTFDVKTETSSFKAGVPVKFLFTGTAHTISFYSGETKKQYAFRDGRIIDVTGSGATMGFTSSVQVGTQANQLTVLASTDFNGDYSSVDKVKAATWTDITNRFPLGINATFKATGAIDISDLIVAGKPIYIAYKYVTNSQQTSGVARQWFIQTFLINSLATLPNNASLTPIALTLADQIHAGFNIVGNCPEANPDRSSVTSTRITLWGPEYRYATLAKYDSTLAMWDRKDPRYDPNSPFYISSAVWMPFVPFVPGAADNDPVSETWVVSAPISLTSVNLGPDYSTSIKSGITAATLTDYPYTFAQPGTYEVVFVGFTSYMDEVKKVVKTMTITVAP